ncbi:MAG: GGDEF and EAL domain-containing protein [Candidatus Magnetoovum sp. WYHC-5]|nr:GGDEF and EAL domain-containing protein [Candidatus Magnetoovum sp. WYHC-5]
MSNISWDFDLLRQQISKNNGNLLENLMREALLVDGILTSIDEITTEMLKKDDIKNYIITLRQLIGIFIKIIKERVALNTQLTKEGLYGSLIMIDSLEVSSIDAQTLEKLTKVLMSILLSREDVINWEKRAERIIVELCNIYSFSIFFNVFESRNYLEAHIYYLVSMEESKRHEIVEEIKRTILKYYQIDDIIQTFPLKTIEINLHGKILEENKNLLLIKTNDYLLETSGMGGILGVAVFASERISRKDNEILESILSIMTLVIGSSKALSKAIKELEYYAGHDPLTGLYNRRMFEHFLQYEITRVKRKQYKFSLFLQDLDDFKYINDSYGHPFGDLYLKEVSETLVKSLRDGDVVARLGGDEFAVILSETALSDARILAERIKKTFEIKKITTPDNKIIPIKASIGLVEYPTHGTSMEELLVVVDAALYKAKELGKNKVFVPTADEIKSSLKAQTAKFNILQEGIDDDRFEPFFQPIVDVASGEILAYEVLARLRSRNGELIPAINFINMAERLGKIFDIDRQIIKKAFQKKAATANPKLFFVNLSGKEIKDISFINYIIGLALEYEINTEELVFEITEREAVGDLSNIQELTSILNHQGIRIAIDDFGSGYSSFFYVKYIPVDFVKIDGEFIRELDKGDIKDIAFVESIQTLCKKLDIKTIAEYTENQGLLNIIKELGIQYAQGFYLGSPKESFL